MVLATIKTISPKNFATGLLISSFLFSLVFLANKLHLIELGTSVLNDNFIKQIYGHSYLADLVVLTFPFIISRIGQKASILSKYLNFALLLLFLVVLILTNSRSGVIALVVGIVFLTSKNNLQKIIKISLVVLSLIFLLISTTPKYQNRFNKTLTSQRDKYWHIAIQGFIDSPIVGNGPNTFSMIRRQKQDQPVVTSVAHSSFFTFLCENGIIFTLLFFSLIVFGLKQTQKNNPLFFSAAIIAITHSLLDPTWSSPGILIISLYLIFYYSYILDHSKNPKNLSPPLLGLALFCSIFFILDTASNRLLLQHQYQSSLIFNPFNLNSRIEIMSITHPQNEIWQKNLQFLQKYFRNNEIVYKTLVEITPFPQNEKYYYQLFDLNPKESYPYYLNLLNRITRDNDSPQLETLLNYLDQNFNENEIPSTYAIPLSIATYNYALKLYHTSQPQTAVDYFRLTTKFVPILGHYQVDFANSLWYTGQKDQAINQLSQVCQKYFQAKDHCSLYLENHLNDDFNQPGTEEYLQHINQKLQ